MLDKRSKLICEELEGILSAVADDDFTSFDGYFAEVAIDESQQSKNVQECVVFSSKGKYHYQINRMFNSSWVLLDGVKCIEISASHKTKSVGIEGEY